MPNRTRKAASAIFASVLAGAALATISHSAARAADDCLTAPKDETPEGSHWYYRIEHATKRHCWYLREEGEKPAQTAAPSAARAAKPIAPKAETPTQRSIANAHAELPAQTSIEQTGRNDTLFPPVTAVAPIREDNAAADARPSVVASRWPDPSAASSAAGQAPVGGNMVANVESTPAEAPPPAVAAAVPLAAADSSQGRSASMPMLLSVLTGALALAGIAARIIFKFGGRRRRAKVRRDKIWESANDGRIAISARRNADVVPRRAGRPRDLDQTSDRSDRAAEFFAQLSKRSHT